MWLMRNRTIDLRSGLAGVGLGGFAISAADASSTVKVALLDMSATMGIWATDG